jgi:hypothetical protein
MDWRGESVYGNPFDLPMVAIHEYRDELTTRQTIHYAARNACDQLASS